MKDKGLIPFVTLALFALVGAAFVFSPGVRSVSVVGLVACGAILGAASTRTVQVLKGSR